MSCYQTIRRVLPGFTVLLFLFTNVQAQNADEVPIFEQNQASSVKPIQPQVSGSGTLIKLFDAPRLSLATVYLTEDFEAAWSGSPAAPPGWAQSRVVNLGDGIPEPDLTNGEKDWEQNINTGPGTWLIPSQASTIKPNAAVLGTGVLWMNDYFFGSTSASGFGSRRMESPTMNLSASTSPYVRFWLFYPGTAGINNLRVVASSNGGSTWNSIMIFTPNATVSGAMTSATPYQRINVVIPPPYRTANAKIGIEYTNIWGVQNIWIDDLSVEDFTPVAISAAATGNWSSAATWTGGVVPSADNHVSIPTGVKVAIDVNTARCQNLTLDDTLNFASTGGVLQVFGDMTVNSTGVYNNFSGTTAKVLFLGGSLSNAGSINFSVGTVTSSTVLWFTGGSPTSFSNTGTIVNGRFLGTLFANPAGVTVNSALTLAGTVNLVMGDVNPNGNLTLGNSAAATTQTISRGRGTFSSAPIFGSGVTRSVTYAQFFAQPQNAVVVTPGEEIETIASVRTVTGTLTITTYNNVALGYPLQVGTATTGGLTLTRGILITSPVNLLTLSPFIAGPSGTAPSIATVPTTHGSYISGPLRINFPSAGTTTRNFALGVGTSFNGTTPNSNVLKTVFVVAGVTAWAGQTITASIETAPSGTVNPPLTATMGLGTFRLNLNAGPDLSATAAVTIRGRNSTFGNSDNLLGQQQELRVAQATSTSGSWSERSVASGAGAFVNNTDYPRTSATAAPGPIAPLATNGEYFAVATTAANMVYDSSTALQPNTGFVRQGSTNQDIIAVRVNVTGSLSPLDVTSVTFNTNGTTNAADLLNARVFYTGNSSAFSTGTQFGSTVPSPSGSFVVTGSQALLGGANYFWLAYDIASGAALNNYVDGECTSITVGGTPQTPTVTAPAGARQILNPCLTDYTVSRMTGITFNSISGTGNSFAAWRNGTNIDDNRSAATSIGFTFNYMGNNYTMFSAATNGYLDFSSSTATGSGTGAYGYENAQFTAITGTLLALGPLYDDLIFPSGTPQANVMKYQVDGTAPSRVLTIEWIGVRHFSSSTAGNMNIQAKLYETSNKIEFVYGSMDGGTGTFSYTVGLNEATMSAPPDVCQLLTQQTANSSTFSNTPQNALTIIPEANSMLAFEILPPALKDIQVSSVLTAPPIPTLGSPITVSAVIVNNGTEPNPTSVPLTYKIGSPPASQGDGTGETFTPSWTGDTDTVTFAVTYTPGSLGSLTVYVRSFYTGDEVSGNDIASTTITVNPAGTVFSESFTTTTFPPSGWSRTGPAALWGRLPAVQSDGSTGGAARSDFYGVSSGVDSLKTPTVDFSALASLPEPKVLKFDHAYRTYITESDSIFILLSSDGGTTWTDVLYADGHPNMSTLPPSTSAYTPGAASEWRGNIFPLPPAYLVSTARIAFVAKTAFGNNFWLDNVVVRTLPDTDYAMISLTQPDGIPTPFGPVIRNRGDKSKSEIALDGKMQNGTLATPHINNSRMIQRSFKASLEEGLLPIELQTIVQNVGQSSPAYQIGWTFDGVSQPPVPRGGIASLATDTVDLSLTPSQRGTFTTVATATLSGDDYTGDNSRTYLRSLVYPDPNIRIRYDNGNHTPETFIGFGGSALDIEAGVRFTAPEALQLANIDAYYSNELSTDSITVKVYAAGANDTTPGALLYSKKFAGENYISANGDYITLPLGNDAPTFDLGSDFWVSILFAPGIQYPMGAQTTGISPGRSFYSPDSGATWFRLVLPPEYAWLLRVVGVPGGGGTVTIGVPVAVNWNIVSLPVSDPVPDDSVRHVYTNSINAYAFAFQGGYVQRYTLDNGPGYWIKSSAAYTQDITGTARDTLTIPVATNWNMIGSISTSIDTSVAHVTPSVPGLRVSNFFKYQNGYVIASTIDPGLGYWVKASANGSFFMHLPTGQAGATTAPGKPSGELAKAQRTVEELNTLTIKDASGGSQTLYFGTDAGGDIPVNMYVMPPAPPEGSFDARFTSSEGGMMVQTHVSEISELVELPIAIQSSAYPLTVSWKVNSTDAVYELGDGRGAIQSLRGEGTLKISNREWNQLTLRVMGSGSGLPKEFALYQNYPNPFNPTTSIKFALPVDSRITMEMYNIVGQRVKTLIDGEQTAGYHVAEWNGTNDAGKQVASGMYFLRMSAEGKNGKKFTDVRKLMLLK